MNSRKIREGLYWLGAIDWDRRLFDSLIPLPDGTSYNAYLIQGSEKTALLDTVDPSMKDVLLSQLESIQNLDYLVSHHAEQDHSGSIPYVLEKFKKAQVVTTPKGKEMLMELLRIHEDRFRVVKDDEMLSLGDRTLKFIHAPWVHWPETMVTYLEEEHILFTGDFFGCHLATTDLYATDEARIYDATRRFYAQIMMPFRTVIVNNLEKIKRYEISLIAAGHGPIHNKPAFIIEAYLDWISSSPKNIVVLPYISMHGSTGKMVEYFVSALAQRGITVEQFNLASTDIGKLATALVDAATLVVGSPTMLGGLHPSAAHAISLINALRPKLKFVSLVGSYGWGGKAVEQLKGMISSLKAEMLAPVLCKGMPGEADFLALNQLATIIAEKHKENNFN